MRRDGGSGRTGSLRSRLWTAARVAVVGVANTAVGFGGTLVLEFVFSLSPALANAGGYAVGIPFSFILNRRFTFGDRGRAGPAALRFALAVASAFALNQAVLQLAIGQLGRAGPGAVLSQAASAVSYTVTLFILCRLWVFRDATGRSGPDRDKQDPI